MLKKYVLMMGIIVLAALVFIGTTSTGEASEDHNLRTYRVTIENETDGQPNPHPRRDHARNQRDQSRRAGERSEEKGGVEQQNHVSWCGAGARQIRP